MFMYEKIAAQPHLRTSGDPVQRMMYRRAIEIKRGIKRAKNKIAA
jgi:hypothetical protein